MMRNGPSSPLWYMVTALLVVVILLLILPWLFLAGIAVVGVWLQRSRRLVLDFGVLRRPFRGHETSWVTVLVFFALALAVITMGWAGGMDLSWVFGAFIAFAIVALESMDLRLEASDHRRWWSAATRWMSGRRGPAEGDEGAFSDGSPGWDEAAGPGAADGQYTPPSHDQNIPDCFITLFFDHTDVTELEIIARYRKLSSVAHPDAGGGHESFIRLQDARDECLRFVRARAGRHRSS